MNQRSFKLVNHRQKNQQRPQLVGKTWAEFYKIKMIDRASGYVDPDEDFQLEEKEDQDDEEEELESEEDESEVIQVGQSQTEEPTETPVGVASDEPVASRTRS